ncbi:hypothetical protein DSUL_20485 [Desulfovibrionales bacterium]
MLYFFSNHFHLVIKKLFFLNMQSNHCNIYVICKGKYTRCI